MAIEKYIVCDRCNAKISYYGISFERLTYTPFFLGNKELFLCRKCFWDFQDFMKNTPKNKEK